MALSEAWLKTNNGKVRDKVEEVADRDSMSVRVSAKGKIVFQLRYRFNGKPYRLDLGSYPNISLKDARAEANRLRALLEQGKNPKVEVLVERNKHIDPLTLDQLFEKWYESFCKPNKKLHDQVKSAYLNHISPQLGKYPIERVDIEHWLELFEKLAAKQPGTAKVLLSNVKQMLKWAAKRKLILTNVLADIFPKEDLNITYIPSKRVLTDEELVVLFECLKWSRLTEKNKIFIQLCLIYGCRKGELRLAEKKHFDLKKKVWLVPPENHKTGYKNDKTLIRPILPEMEALILEAMELSKGKYLFNNGEKDEAMSSSASTALSASVIGWVKRFKKEDMNHWSMHDLRRTARTNFSRFTERRDVAEMMIGHSMPQIQEVYDLYDYVKEQAEIYEKWIARLEKLKNGIIED
ncbi:tyrosine-type recombinase/integrase [Acinetobacter calcoaceticus]|uniref:tyrosine-type recombinase/integrase n=1 Tax=Acinetobacter calcoaceticus TaxID=471 RepID=UPI0002CE53D5|nr:integrase family protein [Acinetobacter calcoaceticus]ENU07782.1 hypothetical protein F997_03645 [Acinetobacter calcoaceticus NIPH 13]